MPPLGEYPTIAAAPLGWVLLDGHEGVQRLWLSADALTWAGPYDVPASAGPFWGRPADVAALDDTILINSNALGRFLDR